MPTRSEDRCVRRTLEPETSSGISRAGDSVNPRAIHRRPSSRFCLAPHFSWVPQNGHASANTAVPRWHCDLKNALRIAIPHKSVSSATFETLRALGPRDAFLLSVRRWHEWNAKPERSIGLPIAVLRKTLPFFHLGNRLLDAQQSLFSSRSSHLDMRPTHRHWGGPVHHRFSL